MCCHQLSVKPKNLQMAPAVAQLPLIEVLMYFLIWIGGVFYSAYHVYLASNNLAMQLGPEELDAGWNVIGRKKDISDYEWHMWLPFLRELVPWFFLHHIVAEFIRWQSNKALLRVWYLSVTAFFTVYHCGWLTLLTMLSSATLLYEISLAKRPMFCWAASILLLICLSIFQIPMLSEEQIMIVYVCFAWIQLRCISSCLDMIDCKPWTETLLQSDPSPPLLRHLSYVFYLPLMFLGPFVLYRDFEHSFSVEGSTWQSLSSRILHLILNLCRFCGWLILTEFCLHFIYCNAIQLHHEALPLLDAWTLNGLAYCIGQFFLNKYVVVYGLMGTLAKFDQVNAPHTPRCIAHISTYSDMWRHFDRGFYNFLRSYVYDPMLTKFPERRHHIFLSIICFVFVYVWHGLAMNILVWSICNFIGILLETLGSGIATAKLYQDFESNLTLRTVRRWRALVLSPLFIMSALTMFFFLGGMEVGLVFVSQILNGTVGRNFALLMFAYCMCQVSLEIKMMRGHVGKVRSS